MSIIRDADRAIDQLQKISALPANWDTHNAPVIDRQSLDDAFRWVAGLLFQGQLEVHPYPTAGGYVAIDFKLGGEEFSIIFDEDRTPIHYNRHSE